MARIVQITSSIQPIASNEFSHPNKEKIGHSPEFEDNSSESAEIITALMQLALITYDFIEVELSTQAEGKKAA